MKRDYEYIVLGLGGLGSSVAYWLSRRAGGDVLGLEQFEIGHHHGGSQDHSRIIRLSYRTPGYVALAREAYKAWSVLEEEAGKRLILKTGGLDLAPAQTAVPLSDYSNSLTACGVPFEMLDAVKVMRRWPQFHLPDDVQGLYQAESGLVAAAKANAAHIRLARKHGAVLQDGTAVTSVRAVDGEVEVVADTAFRCRKLLVTGGAWSNTILAHFDCHLPLRVTQEQVTYFACPYPIDFAPDRFPIWVWLDESGFYGVPVYGEGGVKVGQDMGGAEVTAETRTFDPDPAALERVQAFVRQYIPGALGAVIRTKTCLYTLTPDRDFIVDTIPGQPNVYVAVGAGHAFKFASVLGKSLSELAIDGATGYDLAPFAIDRPMLYKG